VKYHFARFAYCPRCAAPFGPADFDAAAVMFLCPMCGNEFYQHSVPAVTAVVPCAADPRRILFITRRTPPGEGLLALPGGILAHAEDPAQGAVRETLEETTVVAQVERLLRATLVDYVYRGARISVLELAYLMRPSAADVRAVLTPEAAQLDFLDPGPILRSSGVLAFPEQAAVLAAYQERLQESLVHQLR
jgi:ADP-ribose pyrophosphatase YjhB (NUDIX family)